MTVTTYRYLGDRFTDLALKGALCEAIRNESGKCVRGRNGAMLVRFLQTGQATVVIGRLLRKTPKPEVA